MVENFRALIFTIIAVLFGAMLPNIIGYFQEKNDLSVRVIPAIIPVGHKIVQYPSRINNFTDSDRCLLSELQRAHESDKRWRQLAETTSTAPPILPFPAGRSNLWQPSESWLNLSIHNSSRKIISDATLNIANAHLELLIYDDNTPCAKWPNTQLIKSTEPFKLGAIAINGGVSLYLKVSENSPNFGFDIFRDVIVRYGADKEVLPTRTFQGSNSRETEIIEYLGKNSFYIRFLYDVFSVFLIFIGILLFSIVLYRSYTILRSKKI